MAYDFKKVKILVVESSIPMFELLKEVLRVFSVPLESIDSAYTAEEGFEKFCKRSHDLLIVDWLENPDKGIFLTRQVRMEKRSPDRFVPVIMTAGSGHKNRVIKARDAGISEYLVKPFNASQLAKKIERVVERPRAMVVCDTYVGPDRRSAKPSDYSGPERRISPPAAQQALGKKR